MFLFAFLIACGGAEPAEPEDTDVPAGLSVENYTSSECTSRLSADTASGVPESIAATSDAAGVVHIAHTSVSANCCEELTPDPVLLDTTLRLTYVVSGEVCDCMCTFDLAYDITGVASGTYEVAYGDVTTTVTVP